MDVDPGRIQLQFVQGGQCHDGKGFVDFVQVDVLRLPLQFLQQFPDGEHGSGGKPCRLMGKAGMTGNAGQGSQAPAQGFRLAHQCQGGSSIGNGAGVGRGDGAVAGKGRFQAGDPLRAGRERLFVLVDAGVAMALYGIDADDFGCKRTGLLRVQGAFERAPGVIVLLLAAKAVVPGAALGKHAHQGAFFVGVLQPVEEHVVLRHAVPQTLASTHFRQQVRCVRHAFHAARQHDAGAAGQQGVVSLHHGLHAGAAHLVDRGAGHMRRQSCCQGSLTRWSLPLSGRQYAAHDDFVDRFAGDVGTAGDFGQGCGSQGAGGQAGQAALQTADGGTGSGNNHDRIGGRHVFLLCFYVNGNFTANSHLPVAHQSSVCEPGPPVRFSSRRSQVCRNDCTSRITTLMSSICCIRRCSRWLRILRNSINCGASS